jgi:hypothetical protein
LLFTVVHTNGIHATRIRVCGCLGAPEKVTQLMQSQLFPATTQDPKTAFTFSVLKNFHMHNLQSKCGAFDYMLSLRRLTDNVFTNKVPVREAEPSSINILSGVQDPYKAFLRVTRVWDYLTTKRRTGQAHNIDTYLPHRPPGNVAVVCPSCPEPGINMEARPEMVPHELR